jgi:hypothetical protein
MGLLIITTLNLLSSNKTSNGKILRIEHCSKIKVWVFYIFQGRLLDLFNGFFLKKQNALVAGFLLLVFEL